jgi:Flp pilus assembly protein TadD
MKRTHARKRSKKMAVAFGAVLFTASCATATTQVADTQVDLGSRYDGSVEQLLLYCGKLRDAGELATAASICERAYNIDPTDPRPLFKLGQIFTEMKLLPQAASAYLTVLEEKPQNVEARYLLGKTYIAIGRHDLALQELQFALTQSPEDARIFNALGIANGMLGNQTAARQAFENGLKVAPDDIPLRNNLGLAMVLDGQHEEGIAVLQNVALDPAANATTIRNLRLAESIAQTASAEQVIADANPVDSTPTPGTSQLASTATAPSDFRNVPEPVMAEPVMPEPAMPEPEIETAAAEIAPSQPTSVPREPVTLTEALSPLDGENQPVDNDQLVESGMPVYLDSDSDTGEPEAFAVIANTTDEYTPSETADSSEMTVAEAQNNDTAPSPTKLSLTSLPQPILAPENEPSSDAMPGVTGSMQETVTANVEPAKTPMALMTPPGDRQTAALGGVGSYTVQLASYRSADRAQEGWRQIRASALDLLQDIEPVIRRSDLGPERGIYFRLRTKPSSKETANQLCTALLARGHSCLTIKENPAAFTTEPATKPAATPASVEESNKPTAAKS